MEREVMRLMALPGGELERQFSEELNFIIPPTSKATMPNPSKSTNVELTYDTGICGTEHVADIDSEVYGRPRDLRDSEWISGGP